MREHFEAVTRDIAAALKGGEDFLANYRAEDSTFVRFNKSAVRQGGHVHEIELALTLIDGRRQAEEMLTLSGRAHDDAATETVADERHTSTLMHMEHKPREQVIGTVIGIATFRGIAQRAGPVAKRIGPRVARPKNREHQIRRALLFQAPAEPHQLVTPLIQAVVIAVQQHRETLSTSQQGKVRQPIIPPHIPIRKCLVEHACGDSPAKWLVAQAEDKGVHRAFNAFVASCNAVDRSFATGARGTAARPTIQHHTKLSFIPMPQPTRNEMTNETNVAKNFVWLTYCVSAKAKAASMRASIMVSSRASADRCSSLMAGS